MISTPLPEREGGARQDYLSRLSPGGPRGGPDDEPYAFVGWGEP